MVAEVNRRAFLAATGAAAALGVVGTTEGAAAAPAAGSAAERAATARAIAGIRLPNVAVRAAAKADPTEATLAEAAQLLRRNVVTATELVSAHLERADTYDGVYQAFNARPAEAARARARAVDRGRVSGPLAGIPLTIKDNFFTAGVATTANSTIFEDFVPTYDATAWSRLQAGGAVMVGKGQMGPLATTRATLPNGTVTTVNAWTPADAGVDPGGSSTGPATSVAARMACSSIGTQTGGSIILPANRQNLTGLKPTMGRVSLHGVVPLTYTRDHVGPLARDVLDAAIMLQVLAGVDSQDPRTQGLPRKPDFIASALPKVDRKGRVVARRATRIGVPEGYLASFTGEALALQTEALAALDAIPGLTLVDVTYPDDWALLTGTFNAVRLPERTEPFLRLLQQDPTRFGVSLTSWVQGLFLSGDEWITGQRAKHRLLRDVLDTVMADCDVLLQTSVVPFDILGLPEIGFPIGFAASSAGPDTLPVGTVLGGAPYEEDRLIEVVAAYQAVTDWHLRRPADPDLGGRVAGRRGAAPRLSADEVARLTA